MVAPLLMSATASSASLNTFDSPLTTFGAGSRFALVFAFCSYLIAVTCNCLALCSRGRKCGRQRGIVEIELRVEVAIHAEVILLVAMPVICDKDVYASERNVRMSAGEEVEDEEDGHMSGFCQAVGSASAIP